MNKHQTATTTIARRSVIKGAAIAVGMSASGCVESGTPPTATTGPNAAPQENLTPPKRIAGGALFDDRGYRLYGIIPVEPVSSSSQFMVDIQTATGRPVIWWHDTASRMDPTPETPGFDYAIWVTKEDADKVAQLPSIKSLVAVGPKQIREFGTPETASGRLAVRYYSVNRDPLVSKAVAATQDQIIQQWREATKDVAGIVINPGPERELTLNKVGDVPTEQIVIEFSTPTLDPAVLKMIRQHPQTMAIRWGDLFTEFYCPPCGMG